MRVLVACEFSGIVRDAFAARGHDAMSCDILPTDRPNWTLGNTHGRIDVRVHHPERGSHYQGDVRDILNDGWDLLVAHPPCTHLASSGARWFKDKRQEQSDAIAFVRLLADAPVARIAIENPIGVLSNQWRKPEQIIQPWQFGHGETKATCLWLKNLPNLKPTDVVEGRVPRVHHESPGPDRWKRRSVTYQGIADAMADQWGCLSELPK